MIIRISNEYLNSEVISSLGSPLEVRLQDQCFRPMVESQSISALFRKVYVRRLCISRQRISQDSEYLKTCKSVCAEPLKQESMGDSLGYCKCNCTGNCQTQHCNSRCHNLKNSKPENEDQQ